MSGFPGVRGGEPAREDPLATLVAVMDRLRSPGGCPWDAEQTHESLARYCLEEAHEVVEAIESGDRAGLREELGDLLLQVVFHARVAQEHHEDPFDLDDVAAGLVAKLVRRHPHVFGDATVDGAAHVHERWEQIKAAEQARTSALDGIPPSLPALARAQKVVSRAGRAGIGPLADELPAAPAGEVPGGRAEERGGGATLGDRLLALAAEAERRGVDAEQELRAAVRALEGRLRAQEERLRAAGDAAAGGAAGQH